MKCGGSGFTLLEVVVALAIVSLALGGALRIASSSARSAQHLERSITAHWVARNVAATVELAEPDAREEISTYAETMLGYRFDAEARIEQLADDVATVAITVTNDGDRVAEHSAWIYDD